VLGAVHVLVLGVILLSYWKCSGQAHPADQLAWLNLSIVAVLAGAGADAVFFARGHRAAARVRRALFTIAPAAAEPASDRFVALDSARRYHRGGCAFVAGKPVVGATCAQHDDAGRIPCEVCLPGGAA
jgi:hypothetical protein